MLGSSLTPPSSDLSSAQTTSAGELNNNPDDWPLDAVLAFLDAQTLSQYATVFTENRIYGRAFLELTHETLRKLGIATVGERARLLNATRKMRNTSFRKTSTAEQSELAMSHTSAAALEGGSNLGHPRFHLSKNTSASSATSKTSPLSALSTYLRSLSRNATGPLFTSSSSAPVLNSKTNALGAFSTPNVASNPRFSPTICSDRKHLGISTSTAPRTSSRNIPAIIVTESLLPTLHKNLPPVTFPLQGMRRTATAVPIDVPLASKLPHISIGNSAISISQSPSTTSLSNSCPLGASLSSSDFCFQPFESEMDSLGILGHVSGHTPFISHMEPFSQENTGAKPHSQNLTQYTHHLSMEDLYSSPCIEFTPISRMETPNASSTAETAKAETGSLTMKAADPQYNANAPQHFSNLKPTLPSGWAENTGLYPYPVEMSNTTFSTPSNIAVSQTPPVFSVRTSSRVANHPNPEPSASAYSPVESILPFYFSDLPDKETSPPSSILIDNAGNVQNGAAPFSFPSSNYPVQGYSSPLNSEAHNTSISPVCGFTCPTSQKNENFYAPCSYSNNDLSFTISKASTGDGLQPCAFTTNSEYLSTQGDMLESTSLSPSVTPSFSTSPAFNPLIPRDQPDSMHLHVPNSPQGQQMLSVNMGLSPRRSSLCAVPNSGADVRRVALTDNPVPPLPPLAAKASTVTFGDNYKNEGGGAVLASSFTTTTGMTESLFTLDIPGTSTTRPLSGGLWSKPPNATPSFSSPSSAVANLPPLSPSSPTTPSTLPFPLVASRQRRSGKGSVTDGNPSCSDLQRLIPDTLALGDRWENHGMKDTDEQDNISRPSAVSDTEEDLPEDFWGERPPVVEISENLDTYFPDHDLDQPFMDASMPSPGSSRFSTVDAVSSPSTDAMCNPAGELPGIAKLSHKNSIRHIVQETWRAQRTKSKKVGNLAMRRKSTKMWGVCVSEVAPKAARGRGKWEGISGKSSDGSAGQLIGKWVKGELIGKGSFGRVYHAVSAFGELIAVKQIQLAKADAESVDSKTQQKVRALNGEIALMKDLDHENIVQYLGCDLADDIVNIFLEYVDGGTVSSLISKHGAFPESVTRSFVRQILLGLEYLHDRRILHRDIKGANILVEQNGTCKISDFGISTRHGLDCEPDIEEVSPKSSGIQGSIYWMAPEVIRTESCTETIDIWSLGCVTLEMLSGCRPWKDMDLIATMYKLSMSQSPPIPDTVSPGGKEFMRQCFIISPQDRPTAVELLVKPFAQFNPHFRFDDWTKQAGLKRTPTTLRRTRI